MKEYFYILTIQQQDSSHQVTIFGVRPCDAERSRESIFQELVDEAKAAWLGKYGRVLKDNDLAVMFFSLQDNSLQG